MRQFKIKYTRYTIPMEYKSTPEYLEALTRIRKWKIQNDDSIVLDLQIRMVATFTK